MRNPMSKTVSVDSLDYDSDSAVYNQGSPTKEYYDREGTPSPTKGRNKTVVFKGVPVADRETARMVNGTPHHNPYPRNGDESSDEEGFVTVDTEAKTYHQTFNPQKLAPTAANYKDLVAHHQQNETTALTVMHQETLNTPTLPPIDYLSPKMFPMSPMRSKYVIQAPPQDKHHYPLLHQEQNQGIRPSPSLPAILHSSIGKLQMNFVQNKSLEDEKEYPQKALTAEEKKALEYHNDVRTVAKAQPREVTEFVGNGEPPGLKQMMGNGGPPTQNGKDLVNGQANGVLKVAMYGEFPITATTTAVTKSNNS